MTKSYEEIGKLCLQWWKSLQPGGGISDDEGDEASNTTGALDSDNKAGSDQKNNNNPGDKATLARLRRAATPLEALVEQQAIRLAEKLGITPDEPHNLERVGIIAAVLAHVKTHDASRKNARALGPLKKADENPIMSTLRFRALLAAKAPDDLLREMRRAVSLMRNTANVASLASDIYYWGDNTRLRWTYDYWQEDAPEQTSISEPPASATQ